MAVWQFCLIRLLFCWYVSTVAKRRQLLAWDASPREKSRSVRSREATAVVIQVIAVNVNVFATLYVDNCRRFATFASGVDCHLGLASQASNCHRFATEIKKTVREEDQKQFERNLSKNLKLLFVAQPRQSLQDIGLTSWWRSARSVIIIHEVSVAKVALLSDSGDTTHTQEIME